MFPYGKSIVREAEMKGKSNISGVRKVGGVIANIGGGNSMKKIFATALILTIAFSFCACTNMDVQHGAAEQTSQQSMESPVASGTSEHEPSEDVMVKLVTRKTAADSDPGIIIYYEYDYDESGRLIREYIGRSFADLTHEYSYYDDGSMIYTLTTMYEDGDEGTIQRWYYHNPQFNESGSPVCFELSITIDNLDEPGNGYSAEGSCEIEYDAWGYKTASRAYADIEPPPNAGENVSAAAIHIQEWAYDDQGRLISSSSRFTTEGSEDGIPFSSGTAQEDQFQYDAAGNIVRWDQSLTTILPSGSYENIIWAEASYDENGRLIEKRTFNSEGSLSYTEYFHYDEMAVNWMESVKEYPDGSEGGSTAYEYVLINEKDMKEPNPLTMMTANQPIAW